MQSRKLAAVSQKQCKAVLPLAVVQVWLKGLACYLSQVSSDQAVTHGSLLRANVGSPAYLDVSYPARSHQA